MLTQGSEWSWHPRVIRLCVHDTWNPGGKLKSSPTRRLDSSIHALFLISLHYKLYCHQLYHVGNQVSSRLYYLVFIFKWTIGLTRFPQRNIQEKIILIQTQANKKRSWCLWAWVLFPPQDKVVWDTLQWWHSNQNHVGKSAPKHHLNDKCCTWNLNVCHYYKDYVP